MKEFCTITFEVLDNSAHQMAYTLCKYYLNSNSHNKELTIIDLEELVEHILAYTKAERKVLEIENRD